MKDYVETWTPYDGMGNILRTIRQLNGFDTMKDATAAMMATVQDKSAMKNLKFETLYNYVGGIERGVVLERIFSNPGLGEYYYPRTALYSRVIGLGKNLETSLSQDAQMTDIGTLKGYIRKFENYFPKEVLYGAFPDIWAIEEGKDTSFISPYASIEILDGEGQKRVLEQIRKELKRMNI